MLQGYIFTPCWVLNTIIKNSPGVIGNKAGEFVYPIHHQGDTDKPDVVKKAESLDKIQDGQVTSSLEEIIGRYNVFDDNFKVSRRKKEYNKTSQIYYYTITNRDDSKSLKDKGSWVNHIDIIQQLLQIKWGREGDNNFSGYPLRKIVDPSIITKKFDIYTRLIGVVCSVDEIRRPNSYSLPLIYYTILIRRSLIYLFGCHQEHIFDFFKQVRILPVNKVDRGKGINSPYLLKKTMLGFLWDLICKRINNSNTEFDGSDYEKYVYPYINDELSPEGFEIISKKYLSDLISEAGLETVTNENLKIYFFIKKKTQNQRDTLVFIKLLIVNGVLRMSMKNRIYYYNDGRGFTSQTISNTTTLVEDWFNDENTPFKFVNDDDDDEDEDEDEDKVISESFFTTEDKAEGWVKNFWDRKGFSTPQKDVSELFTSQTDDPDTILQNTRINIRLLDCDSFPAYHFLNYLGRRWTESKKDSRDYGS